MSASENSCRTIKAGNETMSQQIIIEEWKCRIAVNEASGPGWVVTNRCVMQKLAKIGLFFVVGALFLSPWTKFASHPFWYHSHSRIRIQHISSVYFLYQLCIYLVSFNKRQSLVFSRLRSPFFLSLSIYLSLYQLLFFSLPLYCRYKKNVGCILCHQLICGCDNSTTYTSNETCVSSCPQFVVCPNTSVWNTL